MRSGNVTKKYIALVIAAAAFCWSFASFAQSNLPDSDPVQLNINTPDVEITVIDLTNPTSDQAVKNALKDAVAEARNKQADIAVDTVIHPDEDSVPEVAHAGVFTGTAPEVIKAFEQVNNEYERAKEKFESTQPTKVSSEKFRQFRNQVYAAGASLVARSRNTVAIIRGTAIGGLLGLSLVFGAEQATSYQGAMIFLATGTMSAALGLGHSSLVRLLPKWWLPGKKKIIEAGYGEVAKSAFIWAKMLGITAVYLSVVQAVKYFTGLTEPMDEKAFWTLVTVTFMGSLGEFAYMGLNEAATNSDIDDATLRAFQDELSAEAVEKAKKASVRIQFTSAVFAAIQSVSLTSLQVFGMSSASDAWKNHVVSVAGVVGLVMLKLHISRRDKIRATELSEGGNMETIGNSPNLSCQASMSQSKASL